MPVGISRLRIAGFKSFAEPTLLEIRPGLTGIVGPNGCGKSNVVEALRWVMGESSAKSLRGGEMDDVIFAGTHQRAARSLADVTLTLEAGPPDAAADRFPPPFDQQAELEIGRRIERGVGSHYRVNGKEARARDVQTLFADLASGARASAMVSQGRVGALVAARPEERRAILEEAAGIGGLHARRHEAELKLRAADANLQRAEDLRSQLTIQLAGLQKQARLAARYRALSGLVRDAERDLLALQQARTTLARTAAHIALAARQQDVATAEQLSAAAERQLAAATEALPPLRATDAAARTALERARIEREGIEAEAARAATALAAARQAMLRIDRDQHHAAQLRADAAAAERRLAEEATTLATEFERHPAQAERTQHAATQAEAARRDADQRLADLTEAAAALAARTRSLIETRTRAEARLAKLASALATLAHERQAQQPVPPAALAAAAAALAEASAAVTAAAAALHHASAVREAAEAAHAAARAELAHTEPLYARLHAEAGALDEILGIHVQGADPLVDQLRVPPGLEAAIGAVLGEELELTVNAAAPRHMRALPPLVAPPLPPPAQALAALIQAPPELHRALHQIGLIPAAAGAALQASLAPGQTLVGAQGEVWRWDGYVQAAGAPTAAAIRLRQRNRLAELRTSLAAAAAAFHAARDAAVNAAAAERHAIQAHTAAQAAHRAAEQRTDAHRRDLAALHHRAEAAATRLAALDAQHARLHAEHAEAATERDAAHTEAASLPAVDHARAAVAIARATLATTRAAEQSALAAADAQLRQSSARQNRQRAILAERAGWADRVRAATDRVAELLTRRDEAAVSEAALAAEPDRLDESRAAAETTLAAANAAHREAAAQLATAEAAATQADRTRRAADSALAAAREAALHAGNDASAADHAWGATAERVLERLGAAPGLPTPPDLTPDAEDRARRKFDRLTRERAEMGPVNLCAEEEAGAIETRLVAIDTDRDELAAAIHKLRGSIGHLNREGRERLAAVFAEVDRHFQHLFGRMFGGGRAHLTLVGSDDPLQAGLEIYAQPPGKKLAALSLLSGGEQALTALSLIFAVFRCNPAPVCVLDEVDAPLDDANIDRFCALLTDMVRETGTRFLVVTHHHMTMARMDRLYGVTMAERGVSRLLSVDLTHATAMTDQIRMAAE